MAINEVDILMQQKLANGDKRIMYPVTKIANVVDEEDNPVDVYTKKDGISYTDLTDKPTINNVELTGNKTTSQLKLAYTAMTDLPKINSITVTGNHVPSYYHLQNAIYYVSNYTLTSAGWIRSDGDWQYIIQHTGITTNYVVNMYMNLENQAKLTDGYTETKSNSIIVHTSEKPTENIVASFEVKLTEALSTFSYRGGA